MIKQNCVGNSNHDTEIKLPGKDERRDSTANKLSFNGEKVSGFNSVTLKVVPKTGCVIFSSIDLLPCK